MVIEFLNHLYCTLWHVLQPAAATVARPPRSIYRMSQRRKRRSSAKFCGTFSDQRQLHL